MAASTFDSTATRDLVLTRVLNAPVERVWNLWSDSELVKRWWGPTGFTCPVADMDFREGGRSLLCMRAPKEFGGGDVYSTWTYQTIDPRAMIEFVFNFSDSEGRKIHPDQVGIPPGVPEDVRHVITFRTLEDNRTEMTITEFGYLTDQAHDISRAGLAQCVDKMENILAGGAQP